VRDGGPPIQIDSIDDERVADYAGLRGKESSEFLIAESAAVVERLVASRLRTRSFLLTPKAFERLAEVVARTTAPVYLAEPDVMAGIAGYDVHRGILASARRPEPAMLDQVLASARRLVVLEGSNDHENIGVVARSARALGIDALVLDPSCADPYYRRAVRVSMGEILHLPVVRCTTWPEPLDAIAAAGFGTWALTPDPDATPLTQIVVPERVAIVAGAEGPGLSAQALARIRTHVRIPMHHGVDSLNLGHALAIAMAAVSPPVTEQ
jgi:tRNA(Leu) C34 or U34 (ribose-2'-O)-methylase TrmL